MDVKKKPKIRNQDRDAKEEEKAKMVVCKEMESQDCDAKREVWRSQRCESQRHGKEKKSKWRIDSKEKISPSLSRHPRAMVMWEMQKMRSRDAGIQRTRDTRLGVMCEDEKAMKR